jgi:hypothetical protein
MVSSADRLDINAHAHTHIHTPQRDAFVASLCHFTGLLAQHHPPPPPAGAGAPPPPGARAAGEPRARSAECVRAAVPYFLVPSLSGWGVLVIHRQYPADGFLDRRIYV